jgi:nucleotide-binding universal stress UspA family protein
VDRPIVVGTDGSESATKALGEAIRLAAGLQEPLHIVSAYKPLNLSGSKLPPEYAGTINAQSKVDAILADAQSRARAEGVKAEVHAVDGDPADALVDLAEKVEADLLVVGNKGLNSVKRFVLGSVPSKIVHSAPCSVHIVHTT